MNLAVGKCSESTVNDVCLPSRCWDEDLLGAKLSVHGDDIEAVATGPARDGGILSCLLEDAINSFRSR